MFIEIVVILIEVELNEMDIEISDTRRFGLQILSEESREQTLQILEILRLAKQGEETYLKSSGNPFTKSASVVTLKKLCSQLDSLTEEQKLVLFEAEQNIMNATSFYAFINADAGTGETYTLNTAIARLTYVHKVQVI